VRPDGTEIIDRKRDSSALCLACGLCCNGVLYSQVNVEPEHVPLVSTLGLTVEEFDDHSVGFRQPCVLYQQNRCSAYPHHPPACKAYRCALLRKYEAGDATLDDGLAIVNQVKELLKGDDDDRHPTGDCSRDSLRRELAQSWDSERGLLGSGALREANAALVLRAATLDVLLQRHFWLAKKTT
jgi:Fe-S-cluster containining protein